jgi:uncharacterized protein YbjQ (UPF0145 family)
MSTMKKKDLVAGVTTIFGQRGINYAESTAKDAAEALDFLYTCTVPF